VARRPQRSRAKEGSRSGLGADLSVPSRETLARRALGHLRGTNRTLMCFPLYSGGQKVNSPACTRNRKRATTVRRAYRSSVAATRSATTTASARAVGSPAARVQTRSVELVGDRRKLIPSGCLAMIDGPGPRRAQVTRMANATPRRLPRTARAIERLHAVIDDVAIQLAASTARACVWAQYAGRCGGRSNRPALMTTQSFPTRKLWCCSRRCEGPSRNKQTGPVRAAPPFATGHNVALTQ